MVGMNPTFKVKGVDWYTHLQVDCVLCVEEHNQEHMYASAKRMGVISKYWNDFINVCPHCNDRGRDPIPWTELFAERRENKWEERE